MRPTPPSGLRERAIQVFGESVRCGCGLGAGAALAFLALGVLLSHERVDVALAAYVGCYFVVGGAGIGALTGLFGGALLYPVVRCGEPHLGPGVVARLIPVSPLGITVPVATALAAPATTMPVVVIAIDVVFTLGGSSLVAHRYLRRAAAEPGPR